MKQEQIETIADSVRAYILANVPLMKYGKIEIEVALVDSKIVNVSKGAYENEKPIFK